MRVVDKAKWLRAKRILAVLLFIATVCAMNGLEGTESINNGEWLLVLMPSLGYIVWNITKHYP